MKKLPLHTQIIIGLVLGLAFGLISIKTGMPKWITLDYIKPVGTVFINGLKMIAMPLVLASLIIGVSNLGDISKLSRIGGRTLFFFLITTVISICIGLGLVNFFQPGAACTKEMQGSERNLHPNFKIKALYNPWWIWFPKTSFWPLLTMPPCCKSYFLPS